MNKILLIVAFVVLMVALIDGCGFPMGGGGGCGGCGGGGGGGGGCGGGCGRKKRDIAVLPHYRSEETPCPQKEWKALIEEGIVANDATTSVNNIQSTLFTRFPANKFTVICGASASDPNKAELAKKGEFPERIHFSSSGDGYCNVVKNKVWCQAVAIIA